MWRPSALRAMSRCSRQLSVSTLLERTSLLRRDFAVDLGLGPSSPLARAQGSIPMYYLDETDAQVVVDEVFSDALNGYFGKGGLVVPPSGATILDIGANIGAFSVFMQRVVPGCSVLAFEPMPDVFRALQANFALHNIDGSTHRCGLSRVDGPEALTFTHFPMYSRCSTYRPQDKYRANMLPQLEPSTWCTVNRKMQPALAAEIEAMPTEEARARVRELIEEQYTAVEVQVPMTSVQRGVQQHDVRSIDFLKVDVEGAELDVLLGVGDAWPLVQQAHELRTAVSTQRHVTGHSQCVAGGVRGARLRRTTRCGAGPPARPWFLACGLSRHRCVQRNRNEPPFRVCTPRMSHEVAFLVYLVFGRPRSKHA